MTKEFRPYLRFYGARGSYPAVGPGFSAYGGHTACVACFLPDRVLVLDAGTGMIALGKELSAGDAPDLPIDVFLSHLHYDHVLGLPFFAPVYQGQRPISVYAPENMILPLRTFWGPPYFPVDPFSANTSLQLKGIMPGEEVPLADGFALRCLYLEGAAHPQDGVMLFRLQGPEGDLVYATDVELHTDELMAQVASFASGARLLLCDAMFTDGKDYEQHRGWGHSSVGLAQELAEMAEVGELLLFHHDPTRDDVALRTILQSFTSKVPVRLGAEGLTIPL